MYLKLFQLLQLFPLSQNPADFLLRRDLLRAVGARIDLRLFLKGNQTAQQRRGVPYQIDRYDQKYRQGQQVSIFPIPLLNTSYSIRIIE